jgi:hypothetical protein
VTVAEGMVAMYETWSSHETWVYECLCCFEIWEEEFDIRHSADGRGGEVVVFEHHGHRCPTPWVDHACPYCGSVNVKAVQAPWGRGEPAVRTRTRDDLELVFRLRRLHAY